MTWRERFTALEHADPASEVVVVLYRLRGAPEVFALEAAQDTGESVRLAISEVAARLHSARQPQLNRTT
jgi:hypothetical protein